MNGKLIILVAPSGSGKTSIVKYLLKQNVNLAFSISATTRLKRSGEIDGKDYYFLSLQDFKNKIEKNQFLEWEEVYKGIYYGTLKSEIDNKLAQGMNIIIDVDVLGGMNIKKYYQDRALALFIEPPSIESLRERLKNRGTETEESLQKRIDKAAFELSFKSQFDAVIINDILEKAQQKILQIISRFLKK
jgi:guanylate kinase